MIPKNIIKLTKHIFCKYLEIKLGMLFLEINLKNSKQSNSQCQSYCLWSIHKMNKSLPKHSRRIKCINWILHLCWEDTSMSLKHKIYLKRMHVNDIKVHILYNRLFLIDIKKRKYVMVKCINDIKIYKLCIRILINDFKLHKLCSRNTYKWH